MAKEFYTERDIEDLFRRGVTSLEINYNVVLTQLAYEKANSLGVKLMRDMPDNPPGAPVRPYITQSKARSAVQAKSPAGTPDRSDAAASQETITVEQRIRDAVRVRLGAQVDPKLLDVIIRRVLASTGVK